MRVVLDTNTVVSALPWGGTPYALIEAATEERIELYSSSALLGELADVLSRAKFVPRLQQAQRTAAQLIEQYRGLVELVSRVCHACGYQRSRRRSGARRRACGTSDSDRLRR